MKTKEKRYVLASFWLLALLHGCASLPPPPESHLLNRATSPGAVGIDVKLKHPELKLDFALRGKDQSVAKSALEGGISAGAVCAGTGPLVVLCLPFVPVAVVVAGGIGASTAAHAKDVSAAQTLLADRRLISDVPQRTYQAITTYLQKSNLAVRDLSGLHDGGSVRGGLDVAAVKTIIEVTLDKLLVKSTGIEPLKLNLVLSARIRVWRAQDGKELDAFSVAAPMPIMTPAEMVADNFRLLDEAFDHAYEDIAEQAVDELLLIDHSLVDANPSSKIAEKATREDSSNLSETAISRIPDWSLAPLSPEYDWTFHQFSSATSGMRPSEVVSNKPTLVWQGVPHLLSGPEYATRIRNVTYDLKLYDHAESQRTMLTFEPRRVIYERNNLMAARHQVEIPLDECTPYFWTVRMRYTLDGRPQATEWMGAYRHRSLTFSPWLWRRSLMADFGWQRTDFYLPFRTPCRKK